MNNIDKAEKIKENINQRSITEVNSMDNRFFQPNWENKPPSQKYLIKMNGIGVLKPGNFLTLVAQPGIGKTSAGHSPIIANCMNPNCDSHGFSTELPKERKMLLYFDSEMTEEDTWDLFESTYRRAGIAKPTIKESVIFTNVKHFSVEGRKKCVEDMVKKYPNTGLVMLDGVTDFMQNANSEEETTALITWLHSYPPLLSFVSSIHSNTSDPDGKPRCWIGSELCRKSESVFFMRKIAGNTEGIREITMNFRHGKNRHGADNLTSYYKWDEDAQMFLSAELTAKTAQKSLKESEILACLNYIFNEDASGAVSRSFAEKKVMEHRKCKKDSAEKYFTRNMVGKKLVRKEGENYYKNT